MIRDVNGTVFITTEAFCDRYNFAMLGRQFSFATGNLAKAAETDADARALRSLLGLLVEQKKIALSRVRLVDRTLPDGTQMLEYLATKQSRTPLVLSDYDQHTVSVVLQCAGSELVPEDPCPRTDERTPKEAPA